MPDAVDHPGEHALAAHREPLLRLLERRLGSRELAEDATQEAFEAALRHLREGRELVEPRAWLYTVALRRALDVLRSAAVRTAAPLHDGLLDVDADPHAVVARREQLDAVLAELRALPERQRRALVMGAVDGASLAEIGRRLGAPAPVAKALVARARQTVRRRVAEREADCGVVRADLRDANRRGVRASAAAHRHMGACPECAAVGAALRRGAPRRTVLAGLVSWWPFAGPRAEGFTARLLPFLAGPGDASVALGTKACAAVCAGALVVGGVAGSGPVLPAAREAAAAAHQRAQAPARPAPPEAPASVRGGTPAARTTAPTASRPSAPRRAGGGTSRMVGSLVDAAPDRRRRATAEPVDPAIAEEIKVEQMRRLFGCADADARCLDRAARAAAHRRTTTRVRREAIDRAAARRRAPAPSPRAPGSAQPSGAAPGAAAPTPASAPAPAEPESPSPATPTTAAPSATTDAPAETSTDGAVPAPVEPAPAPAPS